MWPPLPPFVSGCWPDGLGDAAVALLLALAPEPARESDVDFDRAAGGRVSKDSPSTICASTKHARRRWAGEEVSTGAHVGRAAREIAGGAGPDRGGRTLLPGPKTGIIRFGESFPTHCGGRLTEAPGLMGVARVGMAAHEERVDLVGDRLRVHVDRDLACNQ